jgi:hypothetical protein
MDRVLHCEWSINDMRNTAGLTRWRVGFDRNTAAAIAPPLPENYLLPRSVWPAEGSVFRRAAYVNAANATWIVGKPSAAFRDPNGPRHTLFPQEAVDEFPTLSVPMYSYGGDIAGKKTGGISNSWFPGTRRRAPR